MTDEEKEALKCLLNHFSEWNYKDVGYDYNACPCCNWNTKDDSTPELKLGHRDGCELEAALALLNDSLDEWRNQMGYCMTQEISNFRIKNDKKEGALRAAMSMPDEDFHWVKRGWNKDLRDIEGALHAWRYEPEVDELGDIVDVQFSGEKLGTEISFFKVIAPFVEPGSFIEMHGEDGSMWRWVFDGTTCKEVFATVTW
jgi:hypothetical protein